MGKKDFQNLKGKVFGEWTVLSRAPNKLRRIYFNCQCSCGTQKIVYANNLTSGKSKHCTSCLRGTHHMSNTKTYSIWVQMIERCHNPKHKFFSYYGSRGIFVCSSWYEDFSNFLKDMGESPKNLSLDRIDNNREYCKENCRWATKSEQQRNRRNSINIGEIHEDWEIIRPGHEKNTWVISCNLCGYSLDIRSCNFRKRKKHICKEKK